MTKDDLVYVGHMLDVSRSIVGKTAIRNRTAYDADENLRLALAHLIQTLGEAARRVSATFCGQHPSIPWSKIVGIRHKIVHDYLHVDFDIVWDVAAVDIPPLIVELEKIAPP